MNAQLLANCVGGVVNVQQHLQAGFTITGRPQTGDFLFVEEGNTDTSLLVVGEVYRSQFQFEYDFAQHPKYLALQRDLRAAQDTLRRRRGRKRLRWNDTVVSSDTETTVPFENVFHTPPRRTRSDVCPPAPKRK
jgi:hypothetical protein